MADQSPIPASMEPRAFARGNHQKAFHNAQQSRASMEPRAFARGNKSLLDPLVDVFGASMEPRAFPRGNRAPPAGMCLPFFFFNGAATVRSRKQRADPVPVFLGEVSMEARAFARGNDARIQAFVDQYQLQWSRERSL